MEEGVKIIYKNRKGQIVERTVSIKKLKELGDKIIENDKKHNITNNIDVTNNDSKLIDKISGDK